MPGWIDTLTDRLAPLAFVIALAAANASAMQTQPAVEVVGFMLAKPDPDSPYGGSLVLGRSAGTEIHFAVRSPDHYFIGVANSMAPSDNPIQILDHSGQPLEAGNGSVGFNHTISEDGHTVLLSVSSPQLPAAGCTGLTVRGPLELLAGKTPRTTTTALALKPETDFELGPVKAKLLSVEKSNFGDDGLMLAVESKTSFDSIQSVTFQDDKGQPLEVMEAGSGNFGFGDDVTYSKNWFIKGEPESVKLEVRYFAETERVKVELDVPVTLGLGK